MAGRLRDQTDHLRSRSANAATARRRWKNAIDDRSALRARLQPMAAGIERCMYCGDSLGTAIDHFEPIKLAPLRAFDWLNHFLACDYCNSNAKRAEYPCDPLTGECLLVDPSVEDPHDHLQLLLGTGRYRARTPKGKATIRTFRLDRWQLERARQDGLQRCQDMLRGYARSLTRGEHQRAHGQAQALLRQPHADVLYAMVRALDSPGISTLIDGDIIEILRTHFAVPLPWSSVSERTRALSHGCGTRPTDRPRT
ncbi:hypothetical protein ACWDOR_25570 [Streptosporangium canum]|uniref:hypothetical protein n=1 Tax=Streptosporangium canum TaxID=324952 RepID=UPI0036AEEE21